MFISKRKMGIKSTYSGKKRFWFFFGIFLLLDVLFLYLFAGIRFDNNDPTGLLRFLPLDIYTIVWIFTGLIAQFLIITFGFLIKFSREPKYEIYPNYAGTEAVVYHNFDIEQLLSFIDIVAKSINEKPIEYNKIYILKNPLSKMFSFSIFNRNYIVLDLALLQIAQTQELKSYLVQNMLLISTRLSIIRMVHMQAQYLWMVILTPITFRFIRELISFFYVPDKFNLNYVVATFIVLFVLIVTAGILRPLHLKVLSFSSSKVVLLIDIIAAERWKIEGTTKRESLKITDIQLEIEEKLKKGIELINHKELIKAEYYFDESLSLIVTYKTLTQNIENLLIQFNLELVNNKFINEARECFYSKLLILQRIFTYQKFYITNSRVLQSLKFQFLEG
ncbi:MAG: hypothetical protein ACFFD1_11225, partial [Candidatus Thorarchaeota archaeon]